MELFGPVLPVANALNSHRLREMRNREQAGGLRLYDGLLGF